MLHIKDTIHLIAQCPAPRRGRQPLTNSRQLGVQSPLTRGSDHTKKTSEAFKLIKFQQCQPVFSPWYCDGNAP